MDELEVDKERLEKELTEQERKVAGQFCLFHPKEKIIGSLCELCWYDKHGHKEW